MHQLEQYEDLDEQQALWPTRYQIVYRAEILLIVEAHDADQALGRAQSLQKLTGHGLEQFVEYAAVEMLPLEPAAHRLFTEGFFQMQAAQGATAH